MTATTELPATPLRGERLNFPIGASVRMLDASASLTQILDEAGLLPVDGAPIARVVGRTPSGLVALKIAGAGGGRISNAYAAPYATALAFVDGELERLTLEACERLVAADREASAAVADRQRLYKSDPAGRRGRGHRQAVATRATRRALDALIALVQRPDAPAVVRSHFRIVGPTYFDAADAAVRARRFAS